MWEVAAIRAFLGIDFDSELKNEIYQLQQKLKKSAKRGRWKYIDNFHLTLKFLGEISVSQKAEIDNVMRNLCAARNPFNLELTGLGTFPGKDSVRVLWLGLNGDLKVLKSLHHDINCALASIGFPPEKRKYRPHITIGQDIMFAKSFDCIRDELGDVRFGSVKVNKLFLFKSEQIQHKRVYTKVTEYRF